MRGRLRGLERFTLFTAWRGCSNARKLREIRSERGSLKDEGGRARAKKTAGVTALRRGSIVLHTIRHWRCSPSLRGFTVAYP